MRRQGAHFPDLQRLADVVLQQATTPQVRLSGCSVGSQRDGTEGNAVHQVFTTHPA